MSNTTHGPKGALMPSTFIAGAAIARGLGVKRGADQNTVVVGTANSRNIGIATDDQDTIGRSISVAHRPGEIVEGRASAAIALDAYVTTDAVGKMITATTGQLALGICRQAATAVDQLIPIELTPAGFIAP
jgi:hypothetical protein